MTGGEQQTPTWNGEKLAWRNGLALRWAWQKGGRLADLGLGRSEHLVFMSIVSHTDLGGKNRAFLGYATIVGETGLKRRKAIDAVQRLKAAGVLSVSEHSESGCNFYQVLPETDSHRWEGCRKCTGAGNALVQNVHPLVQEMHPPGAGNAPEEDPLRRAEKKEKKEKVEKGLAPSSPVRRMAGHTSGPLTVSATPASPAPAAPTELPADTPARRLAKVYFTLHGEPRDQRAAAVSSWPRWFETILAHYGEEDIIACLTWAMGPGNRSAYLARYTGDWVEYLTKDEVIEPLMRQWKRSLIQPVNAPAPTTKKQNAALANFMSLVAESSPSPKGEIQ